MSATGQSGLKMKIPVDIMTLAENKLRSFEEISRYRENKLMERFMKAEHELHLVAMSAKHQQQKDARLQEYFKIQKQRLEKHMYSPTASNVFN